MIIDGGNNTPAFDNLSTYAQVLEAVLCKCVTSQQQKRQTTDDKSHCLGPFSVIRQVSSLGKSQVR